MQIQKRNGTFQPLEISKIVYRIDRLIQGTNDHGQKIGERLKLDANLIALQVCAHVKDRIRSTQLDDITAEICAYKQLNHPDYNELAKRLVISNNHKNTRDYTSLKSLTKQLNRTGRFNFKYLELIETYGDQLDQAIDFKRDYIYLDFFGFKTLEKNYLISSKDELGNTVMERPQHLWMRVALEVHRNDIPKVIQTYNRLSEFYYTHATPTLFNSGQECNQLSSCFLGGSTDTIDGMYENARRFALISKNAGGIGHWISDIRGKNATINSSGGKGSGIIAYIRTLNDLSKHVDQGGKRKGSIALYIEPWHPDIFEFLDLRKNTGSEEMRARDIFMALFINDLFMSRVKAAVLDPSKKIMWSLMCPNNCPGLTDLYGDAFEQKYQQYENEQKYVRQVDIMTLWNAILNAQMETSLPYMLYKDAINKKNNQMNLGTIKSSNLCCEIVQYSSYDEFSSCNLASICLPKFVDKSKPFGYDLESLSEITGELTENLNRVIDQGYYPINQIKKSNFSHRPIGIGVQGLADVFFRLGYPYDSPEARELNVLIVEAMYYGALKASVKLAREKTKQMKCLALLSLDERRELVQSICNIELFNINLSDMDRNQGKTPYSKNEMNYRQFILDQKTKLEANVKSMLDRVNYQCDSYYELQYWKYDSDPELWGAYSSFIDSPASKGVLQYDMWNAKPSNNFDWTSLKNDIKMYGLRNSLLIALMPTASTAQIMGNNECFEPITSNIYARSVLSGSFMIVNKYLQQDLMNLGLWNKDMTDTIMRNRGSVQNIAEIPENLKAIYKTSWEISKKVYLDMASERSPFIDQSQSLNLFVDEPNSNILTSIHLHGWQLGLKTGMYYLRRKTVANAQQFTINPSVPSIISKRPQTTDNDGEGCIACQA